MLEKRITGIIKEEKDRNGSELKPYKNGYGFYGKGKHLGWALFGEFEDKEVEIIIREIEENKGA